MLGLNRDWGLEREGGVGEIRSGDYIATLLSWDELATKEYRVEKIKKWL